jgi:Glycosyltransferase WbsX
MEFRVSIFLNQVKHKRVPKGINWLIALIAMVVISHLAWSSDHSDTAQRITVAAYYFANFHPNDPRNEIVKGKGWSEWELVKEAKPRFPGEHQPNVPLWGYGDESDPKVMAQKIDAAADHGINVFIFDWYYYNDGPFLDSPLDKGFLKASNNNRIKFALMWANHNWSDIHPYTTGTPKNILYPGKVTPATFERICDHVIKDYFLRPSYWRIDGKPYFSFYDLGRLVDSFGSVEATRVALDKFRERAKKAGLPGLYLNAVVWGHPILPGETEPADSKALVHDLGFDSTTSYVWIHHATLPEQVTDYNNVRDQYFKHWDDTVATFDVPYFPNVTMGWDPSPRCDQSQKFGNFGYPFTNTIGGNTPERFREALQLTKQRLLAENNGPHVVTINAWNEWTEGSYLEPDTVHGLKYLEAVRDVFTSASATSPPLK